MPWCSDSAAEVSDCREDNLMRRLPISIVTGVSVLLMACGAAEDDRANINPEHGVVDAVVMIEQGRDDTVAGTIAGAVIGGVVGHQIGSGRGQDAATVAGAAGGAYVGQKLAQDRRTPDLYEITVRMDDGRLERIVVSGNQFAVGQPVRVVAGAISAR